VVATVWEPGLVPAPIDPRIRRCLPLERETIGSVGRTLREHVLQVAEEGAELARSLDLKAEPHAVPDAVNVADTLSSLLASEALRRTLSGRTGNPSYVH
jgi:hypothetical protein